MTTETNLDKSLHFIQDLWTQKIKLIMEEQKVDSILRKQVEYIIIDGQSNLKNFYEHKKKYYECAPLFLDSKIKVFLAIFS